MTVRRISDTIDKWVGLSSDVKPDNGNVGSYFVEEDTDTVYVRVVGDWVEFGGGGNPFSEPVRILVDGTASDPALNIGADGGVGFAIKDMSAEAGYQYQVMNFVGGNEYYPSAIMFDNYGGMRLLDGWSIAWLTLDSMDNLTLANYLASCSIYSQFDDRFSKPVFTVGGANNPFIFRLTAEIAGGDIYNFLEIETQGAGEDYRIFPRNGGGGTAQRGLQVGISGSRLGFYGTTAIAKPTVTGSKAGNAAVASIITQLVALGLVIDGSS